MSKSLKIVFGSVLALAVAGGVYVFFLFKGTDKHLKVLPKDASIVFVFDMKQMAGKIDMAKIKELKVFQEIKKNVKDEWVKKTIDNPSTSGIDPFSKVYEYIAPVENGSVLGIVAHTLSQSDVEKLAQKAFLPDTNKVVDKGSYKLVMNSDGRSLFAWNGDITLFVSALNAYSDSVNLTSYVEKLMKQDKDQSILSNADFVKFNGQKADIGTFISFENLFSLTTKQLGSSAPLLANFQEAAKGSYAEGFLNFEDNRVVADFESHIKNKEALEKWNFYNNSGVSAAHLKTLSPDKIYGLFSLSLNIKALLTALKQQPGVGDGLDAAALQLGLTPQEVENLLGGDVSAALVDFNDMLKPSVITEVNASANEEEVSDYSIPPPPPSPGNRAPSLALSISIGDKNALGKLLARFNVVKDSIGSYLLPVPFFTIRMVETENGVTLTNSESIAKSLVAQKSFKEPVEPIKSMVSKHPIAFYADLNINSYPKEMLAYLKMVDGEEEFARMEKFWKNFHSFSAYGSPYKSNMELKLTEGKGNSLNRLVFAIDELSFKR